MGNRRPDDASYGVDHLTDTVAGAGAEIEGVVTAATRLLREQPSYSSQMGVGQVGYMDEVANAEAILCRIVGTVHDQRWAQAESGVDGQRQEVRLRVVGLADLGGGISARGVEVTQRYRAQPAERRRVEGTLHARLRGSVRIDRRDPVLLAQPVGLRQTIDGAGAREYEGLDLVANGGADQHPALRGVVGVIALGEGHRLAHLDIAREMDDDLGPVALEHFLDEAPVTHITAFERPPADRPFVTFLQRVQADRPNTSLRQRLAYMAANVARAAGDQHRPRNRRYLQRIVSLSDPHDRSTLIGRANQRLNLRFGRPQTDHE
jgi:hypothetical protein